MGPGAALDAFLAEAPHTQLLIGPDGQAEAGRYDRVGVTVRDRGELRAVRISHGVRSAAIAVWLDEGTSALSLAPRPEWPALSVIRSRAVDGGWLVVLRFAAPVPVARVIAELGRQAVWPDHAGRRGLVLETEASDKVAADSPTAIHLDILDPDVRAELGPLDERLLNPTGFLREPVEPLVDLAELDWGRGPTEALVRRLRSVAGVRAELSQADSLLAARVIAGLAMAGVPLVATQLSASLEGYLGPLVCAAITMPVDLDDAEAREAHSVVLRRAAHTDLSAWAWRGRLAARAGVRAAAQPEVSVVMATRRPDLLEHAVAQVARQRGVARLELVLAPHGFDVDPGQVAELMRGTAGGTAGTTAGGVRVQVCPQPADMLFGDVLAAAVDRSEGDVVMKMDDDDWYAPDVIADLLLARRYSGAELVGMPDDVYYLEPSDETVRLGQPSEVYRQFVAGGTMMLDRALLREVGAFRSVRRHVDAELISALRASGAATYRTHGLGYILRRTDSGHTWQADLDELRERAVNREPGFAPGRLMEL